MLLSKLIKMSSDILECLHDGVAVVDKKGVVVFVNDANNRITGVDRGEILGRDVREAVPHSHLPDVLATGNKLIGVKTEVSGKMVISNIVPIMINGRMEGAISVFRDISEVLALSRKLEEANSTIEHLYQKLNFISDMDSSLIIGKSKEMENAMRLAQKASQVISNVLLLGESGTGKEVFARFIHKHSPRANKPFIAVNCAAIPDGLLESELFGYEEGAFTGAKKGGRPGLFELAHEGTIFLDEIGDMNILLQSKLLRVLQEKEVTRVGGAKNRQIDVRVIAATNKNLPDMVADRSFREDLYYRLEVLKINIPPLRFRKEDIHLFARSALKKMEARINKSISGISPKAMKCLLQYSYPGNVRELENILEVAGVADEDGIIDVDDLPDVVTGSGSSLKQDKHGSVNLEFKSFPSLEEAEENLLRSAVDKFRSKAAIARALNISRSTLYRKLEKYNLLKDTTE